MILQAVINKYLSLDPNLDTYFSRLENHIFHIACDGLPNLQMYWTFENGKLLISSSEPQNITTTITSSLQGYLRLLIFKQPDAIKISGNAIHANTLQQLFNVIDIDWEEELSKHTGDIIAHQIAKTIKKIKLQHEMNTTAITEMLNEFLQEESGLLPTAVEVEDFMQQVDDLRLRVDRCEARIKAYENN